MITKQKGVLIIVLAMVFIIIIMINVFTVLKRRRMKEGFSVDGQRTAATDAEIGMRDTYGLQSCMALSSKDDSIGNNEWNTMNSALKGMRINKWKPVSNNNVLDPTHTYCYFYDDPDNRIQDFMLDSEAGCSASNAMFDGNPMITRVFTDETQDHVHALPVRKCVLEIDPNKATPENINRFWGSWGSSHCDNISSGLRKQLAVSQSNLSLWEAKLRALNTKDSSMRAYYDSLNNKLMPCGACNSDWQTVVAELRNKLVEEEERFKSERALNNALTLSNASLTKSNASLEADYNEWVAKYNTQLTENNDCVSRLKSCRSEEEEHAQNYNTVHELFRQLSGSNALLTKNLATWNHLFKSVSESNSYCMADLDETVNRRDKMQVQWQTEYAGHSTCIQERASASNDLANWSRLYVAAKDDYNKCMVEKDETLRITEGLRTSNADCTSALALSQQKERMLERETQVQTMLRKQRIEELTVTTSNYDACVMSLLKEKTKVEKQLQFNVDVYNNLDLALKSAMEKEYARRMQNYKALQDNLSNSINQVLDPLREENVSVCKNMKTLSARRLVLEQRLNALLDFQKKLDSEGFKQHACSVCIPTEEQCVKHKSAICIEPTPSLPSPEDASKILG